MEDRSVPASTYDAAFVIRSGELTTAERDAMKAIVAQRYGGPEALDLVQRPEPVVGPSDVLIAVRAASLNPLDYKIRDGKVKLVLAAEVRRCARL